ncbi:death domain-containing protein, partial [Salmonella sp. s55044]|uniref:death domain-containing protein n=1 Tax=Salmonella sp. s55044 TaxID=3159677 RepID=UPI00398092C4
VSELHCASPTTGGETPQDTITRTVEAVIPGPKPQTSLEDAAARSPDLIDTKTLLYLSKNMGPEWLYVGRLLGVEDPTLEHLTQKHSGHLQEARYQILLDWQKAKFRKATHQVLAAVLEQEGRGDLQEWLLTQ